METVWLDWFSITISLSVSCFNLPWKIPIAVLYNFPEPSKLPLSFAPLDRPNLTFELVS